MPSFRPFLYTSVFLLIILLLNATMAVSHTKPMRPKENQWKQLSVNLTQVEYSEQQFMKWVRFVGSLKHSVFKAAKNKLFPSFTLTVDKNPAHGDFTSIQDAVDSLPLVNLVRVVIKVHAGVYTEKVNIPPMKSFITIQGAGADNTIVQWGDTAQTLGPNGRPLGTYGSATFAVNSPFFIAKNITFKSYGVGFSSYRWKVRDIIGPVVTTSVAIISLENCRLLGHIPAFLRALGCICYCLRACEMEMQNTTPVPPPGAIGKQAVAFRISADTAAFVGCKFLGAQDTLYDHIGRHYYKDCYIEGSVDFIFGNGLSFFENSHLHAIAQMTGAVTAQGRSSLLEDTGFAFVNCKVTGSGALYLGRAWGPFSRVVFAYTYMDNIIIPKGWHNWGDPNREMTVFYGQYKCSGPGANFAGRVSWCRELTEEEAKPFITLGFIDGFEWLKL